MKILQRHEYPDNVLSQFLDDVIFRVAELTPEESGLPYAYIVIDFSPKDEKNILYMVVPEGETLDGKNYDKVLHDFADINNMIIDAEMRL